MSEPIRVEVLHHEGCPLFGPALELVHDCVRALSIEAIVVDRIARYPSPTVLVNGYDVMGVPGDGTPADACRLDAPTRAAVVDALRSVSLSP
ncbi:alkylmercury lyase [Pseudonocardia saturnea]